MKISKFLCKYLFVLIFIPVVFLTVGFSALSTSLSINGIGSVDPIGFIVITSINPDDSTLQNNESYSHTHDTINIGANLNTLTDTMKYNISVRNLGQTNKSLSEILNIEYSNDDIIYSLDGIAINDIILPGQTIDFSITFKYKTGVTSIDNSRINAVIRFLFDDYEIPPILTAYFISFDGTSQFMGDFAHDNIVEFKRNTTLTLSEVLNQTGVQKISNVSSDQYNSLTDVYGWIDSNNIFYWWSEADIVYFHPNTLHAFMNMGNITNIDLKDTSTEKVENFSHWFDKDRKLKTIKGKINTSGLKLQYNNEVGFSYLNVENDVSSGYGTSFLFNDCNELEEVDLSEIDTTNSSDLKRMFAGCKKLPEIDVSRFNTSNARSMYWMFRNCQTVKSLDVSGFDTSNVVNMYGMFVNVSAATTITLGERFDTSNVMDYRYMFSGDSSLLTIYAIYDFTVTNGSQSSNMFSNDNKLVGGRGTSYELKYNSSRNNANYAKIASPSTQGYLTYNEEAGKYYISYNLDGGTADNPTSYYDTSSTFTLQQPTKVGYTFTGWTGSNGNDEELIVTIETGTIGNKNYTAHYTPNTYIVQFNANGGTGTMPFEEFIYDQGKNLTANAFTKANSYFVGWNTQADGSGIALIDGQNISNLIPSGTITLYAQWQSLDELLQTAYSYSGPCTFNGSNSNITGTNCSAYSNAKYINTNISLFNSTNINKDFLIELTIDEYSTNQPENQATILNSKYELASANYPGFTFRRANNQFELTSRFGNTKKTINVGYTKPTAIRIARKNKIIYYSINGAAWAVLQDASSYNGTFTTPVTIGASLDQNGNPMRYVANTTISNMSIKVGTIPDLNNI